MEKASSHGYFFEMSQEELSTLREKIKLVKIGDNVQIITNLIGKPTYDQKLVGKKGDFVVNVLSYYTKIWEENLVNEQYDRLVRMEFDNEDRLIRIISNVEGIQSRPY